MSEMQGKKIIDLPSASIVNNNDILILNNNAETQKVSVSQLSERHTANLMGGIGGNNTIPSGANLNNYRNYGVFICESQTVAATLGGGLPTIATSSGFKLLVERVRGAAGDTENFVKQTILCANSSVIGFQRIFTSGTWSSWIRLLSSADIAPITLFSGTLAKNGSTTIINLESCSRFLIQMSGRGTLIPAYRLGEFVRGGVSVPNASSNNTIDYAFAATYSGFTLTLVDCIEISRATGAVSNVNVSGITGYIA